LQQLLLNPLSTAVLDGKFGEGDRIIVDREGEADELSFCREDKP
jgi:hypothetical protein